MTKLLRFLKLWPFYKMNMGRIDKSDVWSEFAKADIHWREFTMAEIMEIMGLSPKEKTAILKRLYGAEKSAQLDYIR